MNGLVNSMYTQFKKKAPATQKRRRRWGTPNPHPGRQGGAEGGAEEAGAGGAPEGAGWRWEGREAGGRVWV